MTEIEKLYYELLVPSDLSFETILNFAVDNGYNGKQAYKSKHTLIF